MIAAKRSELQKMFHVHYSVYRATSDVTAKNKAQRLLLFYSVECGLKCLILFREGANTTAFFAHHIRLHILATGNKGHDIKYMLDYLNYPDNVWPDLRYGNNQIAKIKDYNQIWRYGIKIDHNREMEIQRKLESIAKWISLNIERGL